MTRKDRKFLNDVKKEAVELYTRVAKSSLAYEEAVAALGIGMPVFNRYALLVPNEVEVPVLRKKFCNSTYPTQEELADYIISTNASIEDSIMHFNIINLRTGTGTKTSGSVISYLNFLRNGNVSQIEKFIRVKMMLVPYTIDLATLGSFGFSSLDALTSYILEEKPSIDLFHQRSNYTLSNIKRSVYAALHLYDDNKELQDSLISVIASSETKDARKRRLKYEETELQFANKVTQLREKDKTTTYVVRARYLAESVIKTLGNSPEELDEFRKSTGFASLERIMVFIQRYLCRVDPELCEQAVAALADILSMSAKSCGATTSIERKARLNFYKYVMAQSCDYTGAKEYLGCNSFAEVFENIDAVGLVSQHRCAMLNKHLNQGLDKGLVRASLLITERLLQNSTVGLSAACAEFDISVVLFIDKGVAAMKRVAASLVAPLMCRIKSDVAFISAIVSPGVKCAALEDAEYAQLKIYYLALKGYSFEDLINHYGSTKLVLDGIKALSGNYRRKVKTLLKITCSLPEFITLCEILNAYMGSQSSFAQICALHNKTPYVTIGAMAPVIKGVMPNIYLRFSEMLQSRDSIITPLG